MSTTLPVASGLVALASLSACTFNESGHLAASQLGNVTHPVPRGSPTEALRRACGDGAVRPAGEGVVRRAPYLQQVGATSAMIGWMAPVTGGVRVEVTTADHRALGFVDGAAEAPHLRTSGTVQMWARAANLEPDTIYCYALWRGDVQLTEPTGFRTAPGADDPRPIGILAFGDSGGGGADQLALREQMDELPYELILHTGDLAYDRGTAAQIEATVFGIYDGLLRNLPFAPVAGNHDYGTDAGAPFRAVFALPGDSNERWYSFDWGRVHVAALDTQVDYGIQAAWLERDLAASEAPWKVVVVHKPPYSSGEHGSDTALRDRLAPILARHHVQLVLAGHDHDYERTTPQGGVTYVVTGGGGVGTRPVGVSDFTAFSDDVIHLLYLEVGVDELTVHAIDATGAEFDSVVIARG